MPNCDWGKPCDCRDCRTINETIVCPNCQFENVVDVIRDVDGYSYDRKGIGGYNFSIPKNKTKKELACYDCSFLIKDVDYFDDINEYICERNKKIKEGLFCKICKNTESKFPTLNEKLYKKEDKYICHDCLLKEIRNQNPSTWEKEYYLNSDTLKWELTKAQIACISCQQKRWLLVNEISWKKHCWNCYKQVNKKTFATLALNHFPEKKIITTQIVHKSIIYQPKMTVNRGFSLGSVVTTAMLLLKTLKR